MITLNILPEKNKQELKLSKLLSKIIGIFYIIIILVSVAGAITVIGNLALKINLESNNANNLDFNDNNNDIYTKINEHNAKMEVVKTMQDKYSSWSSVLNFFMENTDESIKFTNIIINDNDDLCTLNLRGTAKTRESLLAFKSALESSKIFINIEFPLQNILEKNNINFIINSEINTDEISN